MLGLAEEKFDAKGKFSQGSQGRSKLTGIDIWLQKAFRCGQRLKISHCPPTTINTFLHACNGFTNSIPSSLPRLESVERAPAASGEMKAKWKERAVTAIQTRLDR